MFFCTRLKPIFSSFCTYEKLSLCFLRHVTGFVQMGHICRSTSRLLHIFYKTFSYPSHDEAIFITFIEASRVAFVWEVMQCQIQNVLASDSICMFFPETWHTHVERGSSVVECRTRNRESPGSNPLWYRLEVWAFSFTSRRLSRLSCINEYLAIDSGGNVSE